jgi:hypothetical protein
LFLNEVRSGGRRSLSPEGLMRGARVKFFYNLKNYNLPKALAMKNYNFKVVNFQVRRNRGFEGVRQCPLL